MIKENERIDDLQLNGLKLIQDKDLFCFGMDAVLLANYSKIKEGKRVIDLGTGNGILPVLLSGKYQVKEIVGIDILPKNIELAKRNASLNHIESLTKFMNEDIKNISNVCQKNSFDYVITNPPYKKVNSGMINDSEEKAIAKHEIKCTLEDIIAAASYLLKELGTLYMVNRPERLVDCLTLMRQYRIEPKTLRMVQPYVDKKPNLFLISGSKYGNQFLNVESNLIIREKNGSYTEDLLSLYGMEKGI